MIVIEVLRIAESVINYQVGAADVEIQANTKGVAIFNSVGIGIVISEVTAAKGNALIDISSIEMLEMPEAMKRFSPSGGVWKPMPSAQTSTTPKWIGSMPRL